MYPILFSIGPVQIFSFSVFLILSWCVFSFLFWKKLRAQAALMEERIFDLMFYSTLGAAVAARVGFVLTHGSLFADNMLKIVALWIQPGLSFFSGLVAFVLILLYLSRAYKTRVGLVLDVLAVSLPWAFVVGKIGSLLDGSEVGIPASIPWAIRYAGYAGLRHPVQIYEIIALFCIGWVLIYKERRAGKFRWPYGLVGIWFFVLFSAAMFVLEFFKESRLYYSKISANQWILIVFFAEALGAFYVRGGGREKIRPILGKLYAKLSKRHLE